MMHVTACRRPAFRCILSGTVGCALIGVSLAGQVRQRFVTDGVYSDAQAARGQQVYQAECVTCHGATLGGAVGPPLAGDAFLTVWGARALAEIVAKIENTMPPGQQGRVSRQQAVDITAYLLRVGKYPSGQGELGAESLPQIVLPAVGRATGPQPLAGLVPAGNLAQLMRGVTFPNANILFNVQVKDPGAEKPSPPIPFDFVAWGSTVYYGWQAVDQAALALIESTPLFLVEGRRCENGRPVPVDRPDWKLYTAALVDAGRVAYRASQTRRVEAVVKVADQLNDACANCHKVYRDGPSEGTGLGAGRCR